MSGHMLEANSKVKRVEELYISKKGDEFLIIAPEIASWAVVDKDIISLLNQIKKSTPINKLLFNLEPRRMRKIFSNLLNLYKLGIIKIEGKRAISPKIFNKYRHLYPDFCSISLTNICNLDCKYCYANCKETGKMMDFQMIKKIVDKTLQLPHQTISIEFSGGEALLAWKIIKKAIDYGYKKARQKNKNIKFSIQSNGTLLTTEMIKFIKNNSISLGLSLDGPKEIHDKNRVYPNGKGSFNNIMKAIDLLKKNKTNFGIVSVIQEGKNLKKIYKFLKLNKINNLKFNPYRPQGRAKKRLTKIDQEKLAEEQLELFDLLLEKDREMKLQRIIAMLENILSQDRNYICMRSPCGAGLSFFSVDAEGNIYPCKKMINNKNFCIGNIEEDKSLKQILDSSPIVKQLKRRTVDNIPKCKKCPVRWFCGACCPVISYNTYHSLLRESVMCAYYRKMYENLIWKFSEKEKKILDYLGPTFYSIYKNNVLTNK